MAVIVFLLTMSMPKSYLSSTTMFTGIATGSSIVSLEESKLDLFGTRIAFDNLINMVKSRSTAEEVGLLLFTSHMMIDGPIPQVISKKHYNELMDIVPDDVKELVIKDDATKTYQNFLEYLNSSHSNFLFKLINLIHPHYSSKKILEKLRVSRVQTSDMIQLIYQSDDPGICYNTLLLMNEVFVRNYLGMKYSQFNNVVAYFMRQLEIANNDLDEAELELLEFNKSNSIINYYEQTKYIASEKEKFNIAFSEIKMNLAASESVLKTLESKMTMRERAKINSAETLLLKDEISEIVFLIATKTFEAELDSIPDEQKNIEINALRSKSIELEQKMSNAIGLSYNFDNSIEGLPSNSVLEEWLTKVIEFESTKAELEVANRLNKEYLKLYKRYAPLGANMKRLERKINVFERQYLSVLHGLNLAKLKQKNVELNSNLKVVDQPTFSISPEPSKRKYLIIIAFLIGFIIPAFIILVLDLLDNSIKNAARAEKLSGLKVMSIFPKLISNNIKLDMELVREQSIQAMTRKFLLLMDEKESTTLPTEIIVYSNQQGEGKTYILTSIYAKLAELGFKILYLTHNEVEKHDGCDCLTYKVTNQFHKTASIKDLLPLSPSVDTQEYDFVFIEFPVLLNQTFPINFMRDTDFSFIVTRANRAWDSSDVNSLKDIVKITKENQPYMILNGVEIQEMEQILGDLQKKRTQIRQLLKRVMRFQFFTENKIS